MTLAELYDAWAMTLGASRAKTARAHRPYIVDALGALAHRKLTPSALLAWQEGLPRELSPGYRQNIRTTLCSCLTYHVKVRAIPSNPLAGLPRDKAVDNNRQGYFTPEAFRAFVAHARPILCDMALTAARCGGLRASEVCGLRRDQIDHDAREFVVLQKGGRKKRVLIADDVYAMVCRRLKEHGGWFVFPSVTDPSTHVPYSTLAYWMDEAATASGVRLLGEKPVFHHLRHGYARAMLDAGMMAHDVASQMGHKNPREVEMRYGALRGPAKEVARLKVNGSQISMEVAR